MSDYLFAYGTLQPGLAPAKVAPLAAKLRPVGEGFVRGELYDLGSYPGALANPNLACKITGTVMQLPQDENILRQLDNYEGFDPRARETSEFVRERQVVELADGRSLECWFYRYNREPDETRVIASGTWRSKPLRDSR
jgi:gamma-glutamylcyclotransferase (GGCT)/AIG2-like uncharacterized protein YtfP